MYYNRFPTLLIGGGLHPYTQAYIAAMTVKPSAQQAKIWNEFVIGLVKDDLWNHFDSFWIHGIHDAAASRINLINPGVDTLQVVGAPAFTANSGYAGVSNTGYLDAQTPLNSYSKFKQDDMHLGVWDNGTVTNQNAAVAGRNPNLWLMPSYNGNPGNFYARINSASATPLNLGGGGVGHKLIVRTGPSTTQMYKDGVNINNGTTTSSAPPSDNLRLLTGIQLTNTTQLFCSHIGSSFDQTKAALLHNHIDNLRTATAAL